MKEALAWIQIGVQLLSLGTDAFNRIKAALAAEQIDPALLASLESAYLERIARAEQAAAGR